MEPSEILLEESWLAPEGGKWVRYRILICNPRPSGTTYKCSFHVEGLYPEPKLHAQVSPLLAVADAINVAARDLWAVGASPEVMIPADQIKNGPAF